MNDETPPHDARLQQLWREGTRDIAISFLQRAIKPDMTLAELMSALQFDGVRDELQAIRIREVVPARALAPKSADPVVRPAVEAPRKGRKRRGARPLSEMRQVVLERLTRTQGGIVSPEIGQILKAKGYSTDPARTYQLLKSMEDAGHIVSEGERPKTWKITTSGRGAVQ